MSFSTSWDKKCAAAAAGTGAPITETGRSQAESIECEVGCDILHL